MKYEDMSDEEILEHIEKNEKYAIDALMDRYKDVVKIKARAYFLVGADTDDVIQEGMIGLYKAVRDYNPERENLFKTFADVCINRQMISAIKAATRNKHTPLNNYISLNSMEKEGETEDLTLIDIIVKESTEPEKMLIDKENTKHIHEQIQNNLSDLEKKVLKLYMNGMKYADISEMLIISPKSIDNALQRIKSKLSKTLL